MTQADLFGPEALPAPHDEVVELARGIPTNIRFGTSTWTYDGWFGDVYHRHYRGPQPAKRLHEYARHPQSRTGRIRCNGPINWTIVPASCRKAFARPSSCAIQGSSRQCMARY